MSEELIIQQMKHFQYELQKRFKSKPNFDFTSEEVVKIKWLNDEYIKLTVRLNNLALVRKGLQPVGKKEDLFIFDETERLERTKPKSTIEKLIESME